VTGDGNGIEARSLDCARDDGRQGGRGEVANLAFDKETVVENQGLRRGRANAELGMRNAERGKGEGKTERDPPSPRLWRASLGPALAREAVWAKVQAKRKPGRPPTEGKALRLPGLYGSKSLVLMPQAFAPSCLVFGPGLVAPAKKHYSTKKAEEQSKVQSLKSKVRDGRQTSPGVIPTPCLSLDPFGAKRRDLAVGRQEISITSPELASVFRKVTIHGLSFRTARE